MKTISVELTYKTCKLHKKILCKSGYFFKDGKPVLCDSFVYNMLKSRPKSITIEIADKYRKGFKRFYFMDGCLVLIRRGKYSLYPRLQLIIVESFKKLNCILYYKIYGRDRKTNS